jgi:ribonuclease P protein subunit POP4
MLPIRSTSNNPCAVETYKSERRGCDMDITPENIIYHELIGLSVEVETPPYILSGKVVDETRNMVIINTGSHDAKVPKSCCSFVFTLPDNRCVRVRGDLLLSQPENRIPKKKRKGK